MVLTVLLGGAAAVWPAGALAASVQPTVVSGNPADCNALGITGASTLTYNSSQSGTASDGTLTVYVTVTTSDQSTFNFTASTTNGTKVLAVFVKGGSEGGNLYDYRPAGTLGDNGLHTPPTGNGSQYAGISHILFCYGPASSSGGGTTNGTGGGTTNGTGGGTTNGTGGGTTTGSTPTGSTPTGSTPTTTPTTSVKGVSTKRKKHKKHHVKAKTISRPPRVSSGFTG